MNLMKVLERTEAIMNDKYDYDWLDEKTQEPKDEYLPEYDKLYEKFWKIVADETSDFEDSESELFS